MQNIEKLREDLRYTMTQILSLDPINGPIMIFNIAQEVLSWSGEREIRRAS